MSDATVEQGSGERIAPANGIELAYEELGDPTASRWS